MMGPGTDPHRKDVDKNMWGPLQSKCEDMKVEISDKIDGKYEFQYKKEMTQNKKYH